MKKLTILAVSVLTALSLTAQNKKLTLDDVIAGKFTGVGIGAITPLADGDHFLQAQDNCILKYSFKTGQVTDTILNLSTARGERLFSFDRFILSPTEDIILLEKQVDKIFRRSYTANYYFLLDSFRN